MSFSRQPDPLASREIVVVFPRVNSKISDTGKGRNPAHVSEAFLLKLEEAMFL